MARRIARSHQGCTTGKIISRPDQTISLETLLLRSFSWGHSGRWECILISNCSWKEAWFVDILMRSAQYSKTCVRQPPLKLTLVVIVERWLSYKGTCHVILLAKLHDMYFYKTDNFFHIDHYLKPVSKVNFLHRFYCTYITHVHSMRKKVFIVQWH